MSITTRLILILIFLNYTSCSITSKSKNPVTSIDWQYDGKAWIDTSVQLFYFNYNSGLRKKVLEEVMADEFIQMSNSQAKKNAARLKFSKVYETSNASRVITSKIRFEIVESRMSAFRFCWLTFSTISFYLVPYYDDKTVRVTYELKNETTKKKLIFQEDFISTQYIALYPIAESLGVYEINYTAVVGRLLQLVSKF